MWGAKARAQTKRSKRHDPTARLEQSAATGHAPSARRGVRPVLGRGRRSAKLPHGCERPNAYRPDSRHGRKATELRLSTGFEKPPPMGPSPPRRSGVTNAGSTLQIAICRDFYGSDGGRTLDCHPADRDTVVGVPSGWIVEGSARRALGCGIRLVRCRHRCVADAHRRGARRDRVTTNRARVELWRNHSSSGAIASRRR
jgi:hypothetical protein